MSSPGPSSQIKPETGGSKSDAEICSLLEEAMGDVAKIENADVESSSNNEFVIIEEIGPSSRSEPETDGNKSEAEICSLLEEAMGNAGNIEKADLKSSNRKIIRVPELDVHELSGEESSIEVTEDFPSMIPVLEAMGNAGNIEKTDLKSSNRKIIRVPEMDIHELLREESSIAETDYPSMIPRLAESSIEETDYPSMIPRLAESSIEETEYPSMIPGLKDVDVASHKDFKRDKPKQLKQSQLTSEEYVTAALEYQWLQSRRAPLTRHDMLQRQLEMNILETDMMRSRREFTEQVVDIASDKPDFKLDKPKQLKQPKLKSGRGPAPSGQSWVMTGPHSFIQQERLEEELLLSLNQTTEQVVGVATNNPDVETEQPQQLPQPLLESRGSPASLVEPINPDPMQQENQSLEEQACKGEAVSGNKEKKWR